jgi:DNA-directed RNA polymerase subunit alpha
MQKFNKLKYKEPAIQKVNDFESTFTIKPLERGFGNTVGTAIRRVLLSSVSGMAMFAIKIKGAQHEFQTLPNIKDDVVQLIFNLKGVQLTYDADIVGEDNISKITLKAKEGEICANQLVFPAGLTLVNPDHHITNISKGGTLELEIFIKTGRGFVSFEQNKENLKI